MALHEPPLNVPFVDVLTGLVARPWQEWLIYANNEISLSMPGYRFFYPEHTAEDHGIVGSFDTIKYAVDELGEDNGTIYLRHDSDDAGELLEFRLTHVHIYGNMVIKS